MNSVRFNITFALRIRMAKELIGRTILGEQFPTSNFLDNESIKNLPCSEGEKIQNKEMSFKTFAVEHL